MPREYKSVGYKRRQYEDVARIMRGSRSIEEAVDQFDTLFLSDNPQYSSSRFRKAAGR